MAAMTPSISGRIEVKRMRRVLFVSILAGLSVMGGAAARADNGGGAAPGLEAVSQQVEAILSAREEGRSLDPRFRRVLASRLSHVPAAELQSFEGPVANALGESSADLVYTPVPPCRVIDTRVAGGALIAGSARNFFVAGTTGFAGQGGQAGGCGVPFGPATSVMLNFVAVTPTGPGNLRAWAVADPQPGYPNASILNFSSAVPSNLANGIAVPICDVTQSACASDLRLRAFVSNVHVVADVVGYFKAPVRPTVITLSDAEGTTTSTTFTTIASMWAGTDANSPPDALLDLGYTMGRLVARFDNHQESPPCTGHTTMAIRLVAPNLPPNPLVLTTITNSEGCGTRAWYLVSAPFDIPVTKGYDVQVMVDSGTGVWRWIGLEVW
jgi:hypothetical protein